MPAVENETDGTHVKLQTKLLHVTHVTLSLDHGGLERVVLHLLKQSGKLRQKTSVICLERRGALAERAEEMGATVHCVHKKPGLRFDTSKAIREVLSTLQPDVVHTHQIGALFYTGPAARQLNIPVIVHTEHGRQIKTLKQKLLAWWAARYAQRFYCVSSDVLNSLGKRIVPARKMERIANGIDASGSVRREEVCSIRNTWNVPQDAIVIGTVGRLAPVKRHDLLLKTFAFILQRKPGAVLLIVGDGPERNNLEALADGLHIKEYVRFVGFQSEPAPFLQLMSAFLLTSESEGMPLSLLEAWAAGVPVAAFAVGGMPELIRDGQTGCLVPFGQVEQLAQVALHWLEHPEDAHRVSLRAREHVLQHFDVATMAATYDRRYRELLARSGR